MEKQIVLFAVFAVFWQLFVTKQHNSAFVSTLGAKNRAKLKIKLKKLPKLDLFS